MPEFIMPHDNAPEWRDLSVFEQGYVEAMFFTNQGDLSDDIPEDATFSDLAPETLAGIRKDCAAFLASLPRDADGYTDIDHARHLQPDTYDDTAAGRDFWYTRCGHGVGFWDRGLDAIGDRLSAAARAFSNVDVYRGDDGRIYLA